jgi:putative flippase GtrA
MKITKDNWYSALAGFLTGLFLIPTFLNIGYHNWPVLVALPIVLAPAWVIGLWVGRQLGRFMPFMVQLSRFAEIGVLNTAISFGVLNFVSLLTGITSGLSAGGINIPGTILAAGNSYFWNKLWVFQKFDKKGLFHDLPKFVLVTAIGVAANSVVIALFTSDFSPVGSLSSSAWLNIGKIIATLANFFVDFFGYKFLVFNKENDHR